jgi:lambda repressor-like predicted transcriptional regulator
MLFRHRFIQFISHKARRELKEVIFDLVVRTNKSKGTSYSVTSENSVRSTDNLSENLDTSYPKMLKKSMASIAD